MMNIFCKIHKFKLNTGCLNKRAIQTCCIHQNRPNGQLSKLKNGPTLKDFIKGNNSSEQIDLNNEYIPYIQQTKYGQQRKVYFDIYGCQMNVNDTEIIWSVLKNENFLKTENLNDADIVLIVTCAIREGAETKIWNRLEYIKGIRNKRKKNQMKIGILGCMAERMKHKILERDKAIDLIAGPDSYKDLPRLLALTDNNEKAVNVLLSLDETYADITPVRLNQNSVTAFVYDFILCSEMVWTDIIPDHFRTDSIMRGCDNMCTYCIVPFTRGRERSRPVDSILRDIHSLCEEGVKEITLLGQNVNSYRDITQNSNTYTSLARGFNTVYKHKNGGMRFADLLHKVANISKETRVRFTSPHPKDFPDEVLDVIRSHTNVCNNIHLPAQSGSSAVLARMRRGYTREAYLDLVNHIRELIPNISLSSDFICGFCGETEEQFEETLSLVDTVGYNTAFLFPYSMREKTTAHRRYEDNIPKHIKIQRLEKLVNLFRLKAANINKSQIGSTQLILIEGVSKRSATHLVGRNDANIKVIFPDLNPGELGAGDYVAVEITDATSQILKGNVTQKTTLSEFYS